MAMALWSRCLNLSRKIFGVSSLQLLGRGRNGKASAFHDLTALQKLSLPYSPNLKAMLERGDDEFIFYKAGMGYASLMHGMVAKKGIPQDYTKIQSNFDEFHSKFVEFTLEFDPVKNVRVAIAREHYMLLYMVTPSKQVPHILVWMRSNGFQVDDKLGMMKQKFTIARLPSIYSMDCISEFSLSVYMDASMVIYQKKKRFKDGNEYYTGMAGGGYLIYLPEGKFGDADGYQVNVRTRYPPNAGYFELDVAYKALQHISSSDQFKGYRCIKIFSDCFEVTEMCTGFRVMKPSNFKLFSDVCVYIKRLDEVFFQHIHRELNVRAHKVANLSREKGKNLKKSDIEAVLGDDIYDCSLKPAFRTRLLDEENKKNRKR